MITPATKQRLLHGLGPLLGLLAFIVVLAVLHNQLRDYRYRDIWHHIAEIPWPDLLLALVLTSLNYGVLTGHDALAFRYLRYPLSYGKIALAAFLGYAFSHNLGFAFFSGAPIRYRLYSAWELSATQIATIIAFNSVTFWFGVLALGGLAFIWEPLPLPPVLHLPIPSLPLLGIIFLLLVASYLSICGCRTTPLRLRDWELPVPPLSLACAQVALSSLDWALAAGVLYVLLPATAGLSYPMFLGIFVLAQLAGVSSQVPGGLGVFETIVIMLLSPQIPTPALFGALAAYRAVYYLLPLIIAAVLLGGHEVLQRQETFGHWTQVVRRWVPDITPQLLSVSTFISGAVLLISGATPSMHSRMAWLHTLLPLPIIELSHFLGSIVGVGLLVLARGLQQRLDVAWQLAMGLLSSGIVFSLLKGFDYEEALILSIMLLVLWPCRASFYRTASLVSERFSPGWITAIAIVLLGSTWLGVFAHKHTEYASELWWHFALSADAPRSMRATVGALSGALILAALHLLRPAPPSPTVPDRATLDRARQVIAHSRATEANLALAGDKSLLFSDTGNTFIMYGVEGRSWVALGDPIGPKEEQRELAWQFQELCDYHNGWAVFYEVGTKNLPLYLELGLTLLKIGEGARVRLDTFSIKGDSGRKHRHALNRVEKTGVRFSIVPVSQVQPLLPQLRAVSDAWLTEKNTREKGFSLGFFDESYLCEFPLAVIYQESQLIAFANVWLGAEKEELSVDLMRHLPEAPPGVMDYLFLQLMLWGQKEGYGWFNLGMAPFSGFESRALAPLWTRLGALLFRHGEHFYNFQGLRQYKEKFDPEWEPRYLASPGGLALPRILTNLATLISGGFRGLLTK